MHDGLINLLGKDYLNEEEAAHYACVSPSQFRAKAAEYGIMPLRRWMGRTVYRKADIQAAIEKAWRRSPEEKVIGSSAGPIRPAATASR
jgi:hypothetical protein